MTLLGRALQVVDMPLDNVGISQDGMPYVANDGTGYADGTVSYCLDGERLDCPNFCIVRLGDATLLSSGLRRHSNSGLRDLVPTRSSSPPPESRAQLPRVAV